VSSRDPALIAEAGEIVTLVRALRRDMLSMGMADAARSGLTGPQVIVMAWLVGRGPITLTALSRELGMSHSTASGIVDRLQSRGLVRRVPDQVDRRRALISVTEMVTSYVGDLEEGPVGRLAAGLEHISPEQRRTIRDGLALLRTLLEHPSLRERGPGVARETSPR
jgi:DNA-binding MarR family transcriptional regulator